MYYFYQPGYHQSPYHPIAYRPMMKPPSVDPRFLHQSPNGSNTRQLQRSSYPPVDPDLLHESAKESNKLMKEASLVLDKLATSKDFSTKLMDAAQRSNTAEVKRLIQSIGVTSDVEVRYNPDGLRLEFTSKVNNQECCRLLVALRWR